MAAEQPGAAPRGRRRQVLRRLGQVGVVLAGLALLYCGRVAWLRYPVQDLTPGPEPRLVRGGFHVHSTLSHDGNRSPEQIAHAARAAGARFLVMTEHNTLDHAGSRYLDGVLMVEASELTTRAGHVLALGINKELTWEERRHEPLEATLRQGAFPVAAHPLNSKRPYDQLDSPLLAGMEVLSHNDLARQALASPLSVFLPASLSYLVNPQHGLGLIYQRPGPSLARWDAFSARRPFPGYSAHDAHGLPALLPVADLYEAQFRSLGLYLLLSGPLSPDPAAASRQVLEALAAGRAHWAVDAWGSGGGLRYSAVSASGAVVEMGGEVTLAQGPRLTARLDYQTPPRGVRLELWCGGERVAQGEQSLEYTPVKPGACRVEGHAPGRGTWGGEEERVWLFSNPIHIR